jgi:hypothetical protein
MKIDLQEIANNNKSPYSLKRNNNTIKTSKTKLNEGLVFIQKAPKINRFKNFYVKMKKNLVLILTIGLTIYIYYLYLFVKKIIFIFINFILKIYYPYIIFIFSFIFVKYYIPLMLVLI